MYFQSGPDNVVDGSDCLKWLDQQPLGSVLYVCFGSGGTLSAKQVNELAIGLEESGVRFIWVIRNPDNKSSSGSLFISKGQPDDPLTFSPIGFIERVKHGGLLVPLWAPQVKILGHSSTGGFLTHCGWNSILESIIYGVPMIAWPLYAEQKMNAVMLHLGLQVALRPNSCENGVVNSDEITRIIRDLMETEQGKMIRDRMSKLSDLAKNAISENGESMKLLDEIALKWR